MPAINARAFVVAFCATAIAVTGCRSANQVRQPEYHQLSHSISQSWNHPAPVEQAAAPVAYELAGPHSVEEYIQFGLMQNPKIQAARMRVESAAAKVPQAASLQDPMFGVTVQAEQVQTAAGQQELALAASQKVPWFGKLQTSAAVAERGLDATRAKLHVAELDVIEKIKRAYYQLYFIEQAIAITEQDQEQLRLIARIVDRRYTVERKVSQQDVLRLEVEISRLETDLVRLRQQLDSSQASLAQLLHVSPETELRAVDTLPPEQIPQDIELLYRQAITARPELQTQLALIAKDRTAADRARLDYFPDVTFGLTWIDTANAGISPVTNGRDAFLLSAGVNLPIYKKRLSAAVRESEAAAVAGAREYDSLKDQTMQEVKDLFSQATSQQELLRLFSDDIIPKAQQTLEQSIQSYQVGEVDFLQMIDNWRQLLRFHVGEKQLEAQLRQSVASLARAVGGYQLPEGVTSAVEATGSNEFSTNSVESQNAEVGAPAN